MEIPPKKIDMSANALQKVFALLKARTEHDFSSYKKNTICRRIERRMGAHQFSRLLQYIRHLQNNPQEVDLLFKDFLIGVTDFFRDTAAFEGLKKKALPLIFKDKPKGSTIRVWVPGCATGEEAYSVAILLKEYLKESRRQSHFKIKVFATDIDVQAINKARQGVFSMEAMRGVSKARLQNYFLKDKRGFRITAEIRNMVIFALQNVIMDPPFAKLDLLCCRNLFIYLTPELQKKLLPVFHRAITSGGILFLGASETIGTYNTLFSAIDAQQKIFGRSENVLN